MTENSDEENPVEPEKILLVPCSGVEKLTGQLSSLIAAQVAENAKISQLSLEPSFTQLSAQLEGMKAQAQKAKIIALNGCASQCVSKLLKKMELDTAGALYVAHVLKETGYNPQSQYSLTSEDLAILPMAAKNLTEKIEQILQEKGKASEKVAVDLEDFEFKPEFSDHLKYQSGKFLFHVPVSEQLYFTWNDIWAYLDGEYMVVGAADYLQQNLSDIMMVELPEVGQSVEYLEEIVMLESTKTMTEVLAPCSGTIALVNEDLIDAPELINENPYQQGWLCVIKTNPQDFKENFEDLMKPAEYFETMKKKVDEHEN